jgi:hypothetical protein
MESSTPPFTLPHATPPQPSINYYRPWVLGPGYRWCIVPIRFQSPVHFNRHFGRPLVPEARRATAREDMKLICALSTPGLLAVPAHLAGRLGAGRARHRQRRSARRDRKCPQPARSLDEATERAGIAGETALMIASDHGFADVKRCVNPNAAGAPGVSPAAASRGSFNGTRYEQPGATLKHSSDSTQSSARISVEAWTGTSRPPPSRPAILEADAGRGAPLLPMVISA